MIAARVDVAIVGAGLAGLRAAAQLHRDGHAVVVVEARDRIGGRVRTEDVQGTRVDLGAQWIGPDQKRS